MRTRSAPSLARARRSRGISLVELMISIAIGLVLMVAVVTAYLGASTSSRVAEAQMRMNEDAQAALAILTQHIRMAGNNPKQPNYAPETPANPVFHADNYAIRGCDGGFANVTTAATIADLTCNAAGTSDAIAVAYEADIYNTVRTSGTPTYPTDCLGQALTAVTTGTATYVVPPATTPVTGTVSYYVADNRFYVGTSVAVITPSLFCKGNGGDVPQPLVENIEELQFEYGTAAEDATTTLSVRGYLDATGVYNLATNPSTDPERWRKVATVRICVLVRSEQPVAPDLESARYYKCDGSEETNPPDLRLRRAYHTTVVLRNRMPTE